MQKFGESEGEANVSLLASAKGEPNRGHLRPPLRRPVGRLLENTTKRGRTRAAERQGVSHAALVMPTQFGYNAQ